MKWHFYYESYCIFSQEEPVDIESGVVPETLVLREAETEVIVENNPLSAEVEYDPKNL